MSEFRNRLRTIRAQAEEKANRMGQSHDPALSFEAQCQLAYENFSAAVGDAIDEVAANFAEEFPGFEKIRVAVESGHCVRLSRLEDLEGSRKLSRLTFNIESTNTPFVLQISSKCIVFNRERGMEEMELTFDPAPAAPVGGKSGSTATAAPKSNAEQLIVRVKAFAEERLLEFATTYEDMRMSSQLPAGAHPSSANQSGGLATGASSSHQAPTAKGTSLGGSSFQGNVG